MGGILTRDQILGADDLGIERVEVPEWGGELCVRGLTGEERDEFEQEIANQRTKNGKRSREINLKNIRAGLVARAACTEEGVRIFTDADVVALGKKSALALNRVYEKAAELSGLSADDEEALAEDF